MVPFKVPATRYILASGSAANLRRLPLELHGMLADSMDMDAILRWRAACWFTYHQATTSLRRTLFRLLFPYFPYPATFLQLLTEHGAAVGGVVALAFFLRNLSLGCKVIQIYAPRSTYTAFASSVRRCPRNSARIVKAVEFSVGPRPAAEREISAFTSIGLRNGNFIVLYQSASISPLSGIARSPSSAVMNFLTEHSFGSAYPKLCIQQRALRGDIRLIHFSDADRVVMITLLAAGFHFARSPTAWPEFPPGDDDDIFPPTYPCFRHVYMCPQQARFFGDQASSVALLDPLGPSVQQARLSSVPPFCPMIVWRMLTSFECAHHCDYYDPLLLDGHISTPVVVIPSRVPTTPFWHLTPTPVNRMAPELPTVQYRRRRAASF